ncbi:AbgT family transporter, partial [Cetobacterium sp.]|uniref:AbgT family transporter n=1 Tax=Cetobacterium sp. TaxID=2071632 RepID=UPI003F41090E
MVVNSEESEEEKGLKFSVITIIVYILVMLMMLLPENGVLRDNGNINTFLSRGLMPAIMLFFMLPGTIYGIV